VDFIPAGKAPQRGADAVKASYLMASARGCPATVRRLACLAAQAREGRGKLESEDQSEDPAEKQRQACVLRPSHPPWF
jgi:hypothetical protein